MKTFDEKMTPAAINLVNNTLIFFEKSGQSLNKDEVEAAASGCAAMFLGVLRGINGDDFMNGFLKAAMSDKFTVTIESVN